MMPDDVPTHTFEPVDPIGGHTGAPFERSARLVGRPSGSLGDGWTGPGAVTGTRLARLAAVGLAPGGLGRGARLSELGRDVVAGSEVDLVGRLAAKGGMGDLGVVGLDVGGDVVTCA